MNEPDILFNHPHDHFNLRHMAVIPNTCFVLMPFEDRFTIVYETIKKALDGFMVCTRADDLSIGKPILERILTGIRSSELIIADLTGRNANVFYEVGLAHTQTKNVLLLTQDIADLPFDLSSLFCHTYSPHSIQGLERLSEVVRNAAKEVRGKNVPAMLEDALHRTKQIVQYMDRELALRDKLGTLIIRQQAGFSSVSNGGYPDSPDPQKREYGEWLERERDSLISMIEGGATLQAIIYPPGGPWSAEFEGRLRRRFDTLLAFLTTRDDISNRCEFVISGKGGPNLLFFGEDILFEGYKTGVEGGYGWTMVYTEKNYLTTRLTIFDMLFQSARRHTLATYGHEGNTKGDRETLRQAVINAVKKARDGNSPHRWHEG